MINKAIYLSLVVFLLVLAIAGTANAQTPTPAPTVSLPTPAGTPTLNPTPSPTPFSLVEWTDAAGVTVPALEGEWQDGAGFSDPSNHRFTFHEVGTDASYCVRVEFSTEFNFYESSILNTVRTTANYDDVDRIEGVEWEITTGGQPNGEMLGAGHVGSWSVFPHYGNNELDTSASGWVQITSLQGEVPAELRFNIQHDDGIGGRDAEWSRFTTQARWLSCDPPPDPTICEDGELITLDYPFDVAGSLWENPDLISPVQDGTITGAGVEHGVLSGTSITHTHTITQTAIEREFDAAPDGLQSDGWLTMWVSSTIEHDETWTVITATYASGISETIEYYPTIFDGAWYSQTHLFLRDDMLTSLEVGQQYVSDEWKFVQCRLIEETDDEPPIIDDPLPAPVCRECVRPSNPLSIGGWWSWFWCQFLNFFTCWFWGEVVLRILNWLLGIYNTMIAFAWWVGRQWGRFAAWAVSWIMWGVDMAKAGIVSFFNLQLIALNEVLGWLDGTINPFRTAWGFAVVLWRMVLDFLSWVGESLTTLGTMAARLLGIFGDDGSTGTLPFCLDDGTSADIHSNSMNLIKVCVTGVWFLILTDSYFASPFMLAVVWQLVAVAAFAFAWWTVLQFAGVLEL